MAKWMVGTLADAAQSDAQQAAQEAIRITNQLQGDIKNAQMAYLRVGSKLKEVLDRKLYLALHHPDLESYAAERLHLGRSSLYRYLHVYEWVREFHPEWLMEHPQGPIPDLADVGDLIWIENKLRQPNLDPLNRADLEKLRQKALDGTLKPGELNAFRKKGGGAQTGWALFLKALKALRRRGAGMKIIPPEVISYLDAAIHVLEHETQLQAAGFEAPLDW